MEKICAICGNKFEARASAVVCSPACRSKRGTWRSNRWKSNHPIACQRCGKLRPNRGIKEARPLCKQCYLSTVAIGPANHNWKGGRRSKGENGYWEVYRPNHPRSRRNYVLEHIIVWEKYHKQSLPEGWVIHHLNGIKSDNRIENLSALKQEKHYSALVNQGLQTRIRELEEENKKLKA